ncbi:MAG: hypothetical protein JNG89_14985 [Planctomycetaceae bacterium]|nr:hypothetical protein [Planctomycetaceae bacterium]
MAIPAAVKGACGRFCSWLVVASPKIPADNGRVDESVELVAFPCACVRPGESKRMLPIAAINIRDLFRESAWTWIGLIFAIVVLAWIIVRVRAVFHSDDDPAENANQILSEIREMYEEGKLSEEEFRSIKGRLIQQQASTRAGDE